MEEETVEQVQVRMTPIERWWQKVWVTSFSGCWLWTGWQRGGNRSWDRGGPYGGFRANGRKDSGTYAHQFSYEYFIGPIPDGCVPHHKCLTRLCVNPFHLEVTTVADNARKATNVRMDIEESHHEDLGGMF